MLQMERRLIEKVDAVVAVNETLRSKILEIRDDCALLTHGVDLKHWKTETPICWEEHGVEAPVYLFWGVIDRRMDRGFLAALNHKMQRGTIVLVGPQQNADPEIASMRRVRQWGAVSFDDLPALAAGADVLMMPYIDAPVTRAMQPLKMKEYLATGKPIVARRLPSLQQWDDCADLVEDESEFTERVISRGKEGIDQQQAARRQRLSSESWDSKAATFRSMLL